MNAVAVPWPWSWKWCKGSCHLEDAPELETRWQDKADGPGEEHRYVAGSFPVKGDRARKRRDNDHRQLTAFILEHIGDVSCGLLETPEGEMSILSPGCLLESLGSFSTTLSLNFIPDQLNYNFRSECNTYLKAPQVSWCTGVFKIMWLKKTR